MKLPPLFSRYTAPALLASVLFVSTSLRAEETTPAASSWEQDWKEFQELKSKQVDRSLPPAELYPAMSEQARLVRMKAVSLFESNPKDPRRWEAAIEIMRGLSGFIYEVTGDLKTEGAKAFKVDRPVEAAWNAYTDAIYEGMLKDPEISTENLKAGMEGYLYRLGMRQDLPLSATRVVIDEYTKRFPESDRVAGYEQRYYSSLLRYDAEAAKAHLQTLIASDNPSLQKLGEALARTVIGSELELKFTAIDGREVDVSKMRGKVVLVDFWATWCGPCIAELPNVKSVYDRYHDKGFEVIAITLDSQRDRQKLLDFCKEHNLPWPQHFDGKGWANEFAEKFAIRGIPAMFLLDQEGRLVSTNARGERLEAEVRRLLKL
ncbi:MAG: TlpA family protein disulfide reductase [Opitutaceae bacterium]|nr:TlpA family protein disulfide reductase [Opitutaceae bacterium]